MRSVSLLLHFAWTYICLKALLADFVPLHLLESAHPVEDSVMESVDMVPEEAVPGTVNDSTPATVTEEMKRKWKLNRKITGIYGDWLDDHIPPEEVLSSMDD